MEGTVIKIRIANQDAAMKAFFGTNVRQNFRMEKNAITTVTVIAMIVHRKVIVALNPQMEGVAIKIQIVCLGDAMKACFGMNVLKKFRTETNVK